VTVTKLGSNPDPSTSSTAGSTARACTPRGAERESPGVHREQRQCHVGAARRTQRPTGCRDGGQVSPEGVRAPIVPPVGEFRPSDVIGRRALTGHQSGIPGNRPLARKRTQRSELIPSRRQSGYRHAAGSRAATGGTPPGPIRRAARGRGEAARSFGCQLSAALGPPTRGQRPEPGPERPALRLRPGRHRQRCCRRTGASGS
jgi:hypothetical protein